MLEMLFYEVLAPAVHALCYPIGWPLMKLLTLGRHPRRGSYFTDTTAAAMTTLLGFVVVIVGVMVAAKQFVIR